MIKEFRLPDLGEGLTESEILSWKVAVGDEVSLNQVIAEVETAKAVVELPSPFAGVIKVLHEQAGSVVEVGKPIVTFEVADDAGTAPSAAVGTQASGTQASGTQAPGTQASGTQASGTQAPGTQAPGTQAPGRGPVPAESGDGAGAAEAPQKRQPNLVGYGAVVESSGPPVRRPRNFPAPAATAGAATAATATAGGVERPRSTPPVRKLAKDLGVDLDAVTGTGPRGLITRSDVEAFKDQAAGAGGGAAQPRPGDGGMEGREGRESRTPIKGVRKLTAAAMVQSAFTAPHATEFLTVDVTPAMDLLARLKDSSVKGSSTFADVKLTPLTLAAKAALIALRRNPLVNSRWEEATQEIVTFNYVNLGIAAATPRGLTVPNIKDADRLQLHQLAAALADLAETARAGKTAPADLTGGTFSITNIGVFGIDAGTPIINPGEAAILALGAVRTLPWEYRGEVALRKVMTLSLSFDHRLVDGEQGSRFLADVGAILAEPGMVLTMV